jgi:hypothetical protein
MAAWMKKQVKDVPAASKAEVKEEMRAIEMTKLSNAELKETAKGRGYRAESAQDELERRSLKQGIKKGTLKDTEVEPGFNLSDPITPDMYRASRKRIDALDLKSEKAADKQAEAFAMGKDQPAKKPAKNLSDEEKKAAQESLKFKKGGMVKKKPAAKTASRSHPLNKFYGK